MKILHLINLQGFGGAERLFIEYLKNSSFQNEVLCTSNSLNKNLIPELKHFDIKYANKIASTKIKYPAFLRKHVLTKKIEASKADVTLVWDFVPRLSRKPKNTSLVYYDHGCSWQYPMSKKTQIFFEMLDSAIAVSKASKRVMELRFKPKFDINVVINRLPHIAYKESRTFIKQNIITLGVASRLVGLKGIGIAIIALKELRNRNIPAKLIIAGEGEQRSDLENLVSQLNLENSIEFIGYQSDISVFYSKIDIYLSTPILEAFGLSCIEALSNGIPVIFPKLNGQPEAIKDKYCGIGVIPTLSIDEYHKLTNLDINFPYKVYDPISDTLILPKLISPQNCATAIIEIMNNYTIFSQNAIEWSRETTDYNLFIKEFESTIRDSKI
ncbi:TPA: glycosyltransferase [Proteus mirabilis]|uniref:glycosyltransferase n=1 Tax=Proteus sp. G2674 TaxID=2698886 RepID=UPI001377D3C2|nr:glycosyltransferase [Proteus sp. G2674]NBL84611.1 glycosyltransferase [Proteus sp. G2674]